MNIVFLIIGSVIVILGIGLYVYISFGKRAMKEIDKEIEELKNEFNLIFKSPLVGEGKNDKDVLNAARDFLMSDKWVGKIYNEVFAEAKGNLLRYDEQDKREKELKNKLEEVKLITSMKPERTGRKKI